MLTTIAVALAAAIMSSAPQARDANHAAPGAAVVRGRVLAESGDAIRKVLIIIVEEGKDAELSPVFTDAEGRFELTAIPPGRYVLTASKPGYVTTRFGARGPFSPPQIISVAAGGVDGLEIRLARAAAISGHVVDESGDPLLDMTVTASRMVRSDGRARLAPVKSTQTDDLGEYRLSGLAVGSYVVTLASQDMPPSVAVLTGASISFNGDPTTSWQPLYYPSTPSLSQAQPLAVRAGQEIASIDFVAKPARLARVTLTFADPGGSPVMRRVMSFSNSPAGVIRSGIVVTMGGPAETLLPPGEWILAVLSADGSSALIRLTVGEADMVVPVTLTKGARISGRIVFEGRAAPVPGRVLVRATPAGLPQDLANALGTAAVMNENGTFEIGGRSGPTEFGLLAAPAGWTLKSVSLNGRALSDMTANVEAGATIADVQIVLTNQPTDLSGTAVDSSGAAVRAFSVIVFPAGPRDKLERLSRWVKPDQSGRFSVSDLPPGEYLVIALDDVDDAQWSTAAYLEPLRARATRVTVTTGQRASLVLTVGGSR